MHRLPKRQGTALCAGIALAAVIAVCLLSISGCGGGSGDTEDTPLHAQAIKVEATQPVAEVQLEGRAIDEFYIPRTGTPVRALSTDGRLLGSTTSDQDGVFRLKVPARRAIALAIEGPGGEVMAVVTGDTSLLVGACLQDPRT
jgi:hypothetical protein